ncbi:hypothetical protein D3C87_1631960 [compost metagenome]
MLKGFRVLETMVILAFKVYRNDYYGKASIHFAGAEKGRYGEYHTAVGTNAGFRRDNPEGPQTTRRQKPAVQDARRRFAEQPLCSRAAH